MASWRTDSLRSTWFYISLFLLVFFVIPIVPGFSVTWEILWDHRLSAALGVHIIVSGVALFLAAGLLDGPVRGGLVFGLGFVGMGLVIAVVLLLTSSVAHLLPPGGGAQLGLVFLVGQLLAITLALSANNISMSVRDASLARRIAAGAAAVALLLLVPPAALTVMGLVVHFMRGAADGRPLLAVSTIVWMLALGYSCFLMATSPWRKENAGFLAYRAHRVAVTSILVFSAWIVLYLAVDAARDRGAYVAVYAFFAMLRCVGLLLALLFMVGGGLSDLYRNFLASEPTLSDYKRERASLTAARGKDGPPPPADGPDAATPGESDAGET